MALGENVLNIEHKLPDRRLAPVVLIVADGDEVLPQVVDQKGEALLKLGVDGVELPRPRCCLMHDTLALECHARQLLLPHALCPPLALAAASPPARGAEVEGHEGVRLANLVHHGEVFACNNRHLKALYELHALYEALAVHALLDLLFGARNVDNVNQLQGGVSSLRDLLAEMCLVLVPQLLVVPRLGGYVDGQRHELHLVALVP
mmetsp:Transcript_27586/g.67210  ORF Transcript_27586/g.67210 Transcript_27586/m.67210 type:complete len:205 (-) Transcript_27586:1547-2161(-)